MNIRDRVDVAIECDSGWDNLISPIIDYVDEYNKDKKDDDKLIITQIKEKFGGLVIYAHNTTKEFDDIVKDAWKKSYNKCELCGSEENIGQTLGWIITCCKTCAENIAKKRKYKIEWRNRKTGKIIIFNEK